MHMHVHMHVRVPLNTSHHFFSTAQAALEGTDAQTMQAVPDMLEVVPVGWNKWRALERLLDHMEVRLGRTLPCWLWVAS